MSQKKSIEDENELDCYTWIMQLKWKKPDGTTSPLVTIEVKDEVQGFEDFPYREYHDRPSAKGLEK